MKLMKVKMGWYLGGSARNSHSFILLCSRYSQSTYYGPETILGDGNIAVQGTESHPSQNLHNSQETSELKISDFHSDAWYLSLGKWRERWS